MAQFSEDVREAGTCVVRAAGELDLEAVEEFIVTVKGSLSRCASVEIDLGDVTFMDSSALGALVRLSKEADRADAELHLTRITSGTEQLLRLTGLIDFFSIRTSQR
jgi:anti-anti-sigma factor